MISGRCDCGKVAFQVASVRDTVTVCHCSQCRRSSGHLWASTKAPSFDDLTFSAREGLEWYRSSDFARRGFCRFCGSSLFYQMNTDAEVAVAAGCLDMPTGLKVSKHIFVKDKGDYYEITGKVPQVQQY